MKRITGLIPRAGIFLFFIGMTAHTASAAAYEANSLFNSVSRAQTVEQIFLDRWDDNKERNIIADWFVTYQDLDQFEIKTYDQQSGTSHSTDMDLRRMYGGFTLAAPVHGFRKTHDDSDLIIALSSTGFHYGLMKDMTLEGNHGNTTSKDMRYTQFFDDIFAVSLLWRPDIIVHTGMIINNTYEPDNNGMIRFSDPDHSDKRFFYSIELFRLISLRSNMNKSEITSFKTDISVNSLLAMKYNVSNRYLPLVKVSFESLKAYNDQSYDPVWVGSTEGKTGSTSFKRDSARLNIASIDVTQRFLRDFSMEGFYSAQYISKDIYSKTTGRKINPPVTNEWMLRLNYDPRRNYNFRSNPFIAVSSYWNPGLSAQRNSSRKGNTVYGWSTGYMFDLYLIGGEFKTQYNYSKELKTLTETVDKVSMSFNIFARLDFTGYKNKSDNQTESK